MAQFEARTSTVNDRLVVSLSGECDLSVRAELASTLLNAVSRSPVVVVDLRALQFLDSSGIHGLVTAYHAASERNGHLYVQHAAGMVADVLDLTGVGNLLRPPGTDVAPSLPHE